MSEQCDVSFPLSTINHLLTDFIRFISILSTSTAILLYISNFIYILGISYQMFTAYRIRDNTFLPVIKKGAIDLVKGRNSRTDIICNNL